MTTIEFAEYLRMKGYKNVFMKKGFSFEAFLNGYNTRPINLNELQKVADLEGYIHTPNGWMKVATAKDIVKNEKGE